MATTGPDLPPEPGIHATFARDHEYKRHGTLSLLAGIDLLTGKVHALVRAAYPASTTTRSWLATRPSGRFAFTFTLIHGFWLNLIEGFFFARSVLRHIRVASKQELSKRIMAGIDDVNRHPVIHTWSYRLEDAA